MSTLTVLQVSPQELQNLICEGIKEELNSLKQHFQPKEPSVYLTRQEVAALLKCNISTVANYQKNGTLKPLAMQGRIYFLRSDIEKSLIPLK